MFPEHSRILISGNQILMCLVLEREGASGVIAWDVNIKVFMKSMERVGFILLGPYRPIRDRWYVALNVGGSRNKQNSKNRDMQRDGSLDTTCHATREAFGSTLTCCERSGTNHNVLTAHIQMSGKCNEILDFRADSLHFSDISVRSC